MADWEALVESVGCRETQSLRQVNICRLGLYCYCCSKPCTLLPSATDGNGSCLGGGGGAGGPRREYSCGKPGAVVHTLAVLAFFW